MKTKTSPLLDKFIPPPEFIPLSIRYRGLEWLKEYPLLVEENNLAVKNGEKPKMIDPNITQLTLPWEPVLEFTKLARNQDDIWAAIIEYIWRNENEPEFGTPTDKQWKDYAHYIGNFQSWYIYKNKLDHTSGPYSWGIKALYEIIKGNLPDDLESPKIREFLLTSPIVTELQ